MYQPSTVTILLTSAVFWLLFGQTANVPAFVLPDDKPQGPQRLRSHSFI